MSNEGNVKQSFPQFTLQNVNGEFVTLKDYAGKPLIIFMWSSWWDCREQLPVWQKFYESEMDNGKKVEFLSIAIDMQGSEVVKPYLEKCSFPITSIA